MKRANRFMLLTGVLRAAVLVRFAQLDGNVSLLLRAPGDSNAADTSTTGVRLEELVDNWGVLKPQPVTP